MNSNRIKRILDFWFTSDFNRKTQAPSSVFRYWFGIQFVNGKMKQIGEDEQISIDSEIRNEFLEDINNMENGSYSDWENDRDGKLALTLLRDQFSRNIYRNSVEQFKFETQALKTVSKMIENAREDKNYTIYERLFLYLPFEHSEQKDHQETSSKLFTKLAEEHKGQEMSRVADSFLGYCKDHYDDIMKFGRFPYRNKLLGRVSTEEEIFYLSN